jgi:hypothetical protein
MADYRNKYLCINDHKDRPTAHHWESFGERDESVLFPVCGDWCRPYSSEWAERNERYFVINGYGCGSVLNDGEADPLRTLTNEQIEALLKMFLLGDIAEVPQDANLIGTWHPRGSEDTEGETRMQMAASLVYLSGRLASDLPFMIEPREGINACHACVCQKCGNTEVGKVKCNRTCKCGGVMFVSGDTND